jgi:putative copper resistance protein D
VALAIVLVGVYGWGVARVRSRGLPWPARRSVAWVAGVVSLLVITVGWLGAHAHTLLWVYTVQVLTLLLATPLFLAYGRPLALAADALPPRAAARVLHARAGLMLRLAANPAVGPLIVPVVLALIFFSPVLTVTLEHSWAYSLLQFALVGIGLVIAIGLVGDGAERDSSFALAATVAIAFIELLFDAVPGIVLRLRTHLVAADYWTRVHHANATRALTDQQHAGAALWFIAEFADLPFLLIVIRRWIRVDQLDAVRIDRELDRAGFDTAQLERGQLEREQLERAQRDGGVVGGAARRESATDTAADFTVPWWETDPNRLRGHPIQRRTQDDPTDASG